MDEEDAATVDQYQTLVRYNNPVLVVKHPDKKGTPTDIVILNALILNYVYQLIMIIKGTKTASNSWRLAGYQARNRGNIEFDITTAMLGRGWSVVATNGKRALNLCSQKLFFTKLL